MSVNKFPFPESGHIILRFLRVCHIREWNRNNSVVLRPKTKQKKYRISWTKLIPANLVSQILKGEHYLDTGVKCWLI